MGRKNIGKRRRGKKSSRGTQIDYLHFPVVWLITAGSSAVTSVQSLQEQFDRRRPFRIASIRYEFSAEKAPAVIYAVAYGPDSSNDSVWSSLPRLVPTGSVVRGTWRVPVSTNTWFPSDTAATHFLFQVYVNCPVKGYPARVSGSGIVKIAMGPWEPDTSCPKLTPQPVLEGPPEEEDYFSSFEQID